MKTDADIPSIPPVLLVSQDGVTRMNLRLILEGWRVPVADTTDCADAARTLLFRSPFSAVICDEQLPDGTALDLFHLLYGQDMEMPFIIAVGLPWTMLARSPSIRVLPKPVNPGHLWESLDAVLGGDLAKYHDTPNLPSNTRRSIVPQAPLLPNESSIAAFGAGRHREVVAEDLEIAG